MSKNVMARFSTWIIPEFSFSAEVVLWIQPMVIIVIVVVHKQITNVGITSAQLGHVKVMTCKM